MIWIGFGALALLAAGLVLLPLAMRNSPVLTDDDSVPLILVDQLDEVQRDLDRGLIASEEASAAQLEIKRRILARSRRIAEPAAMRAGEGRLAIIALAFIAPAFAFGFYAVNGSPGLASQTYAERRFQRAEEQRIAELTETLRGRLLADPNGGATDGWMLLGQSYMRLRLFADAANAFEVVVQRDDANSAIWSLLAEALINAEAGIVTPNAQIAIEKAIELDARNPAAIFYKAVSLQQIGDASAAYDLLIGRLETADDFAPWMEAFVGEANRISESIGKPEVRMSDYASGGRGGPTAADIAAAQAMSGEDRAAFIRSMVERLASRLESQPEDLDGWLRLANAYSVIGERNEAIAAYVRARALLGDVPENDSRRVQIENGLKKLGN